MIVSKDETNVQEQKIESNILYPNPHVRTLDTTINETVQNKKIEKHADKCYSPIFDTKKGKKVLQALILLACRTFQNLDIARYADGLFVSTQIFFIFLIGTISLDVQKPNAS